MDLFMKESKANRTSYLLNSSELENIYHKAALSGSTEPPAAEDDLDYHYLCLVRHSGCLYELDGDRTGPISRYKLADDEDVLSEKGCNILKMYMDSCAGGSSSLLALVRST
jgi:ubiquitin carboxyl-terminal hydrolase L3